MIAVRNVRHCERSEATESGLQVCSDLFICDMKRIFIVIIAFLFIASCKEENKSDQEVKTTTEQTTQPSPPASKDSNPDKVNKQSIVVHDNNRTILSAKDSLALLKMTADILTQIKAGNYGAIAKYIDPVSGVRFSPYAYIDTASDLILSKRKFSEQASKENQDIIVWGGFDGTDDPIKMNLNSYFKRFVYDVDFAKPEKRSVNEFLGGGNSLNNLTIVYKGNHFTESYFSGFDKKYDGMDWKTLRLVFKERNKRFYLVGVVHDEWTI